MQESFLVAGFGGQGVMMIGKMIGECAFEQGLHVTFLPSYGPEQRGGTANCTVIQSDTPIGSPTSKKVDVLCVMNQPSLDKFIDYVRPEGVLMTNSSLVDASAVGRDDIRIVEIDADHMAHEVGNAKTANVILFAAYMAIAKAVPLEDAKRITLQKLAKKPELVALNSEAFDLGVAAAEKFLAT